TDEGALYLLIGSDTFLDLLSWREPRRVGRLARLVVVPRTGGDFDPEAPAAQKVLHELGLPPFGDVAGPVLYHAASLPISGSDLRRRAREGRSLAYRRPEPVPAYTRKHRLSHASCWPPPPRKPPPASPRAPRWTKTPKTSSSSTCRACRASPTSSW